MWLRGVLLVVGVVGFGSFVLPTLLAAFGALLWLAVVAGGVCLGLVAFLKWRAK